MSNIMFNGNYIQYGKKIIPGLRDNQGMKLIAEKDFTISTTSTTATNQGSIDIPKMSEGDVLLIDTVDTLGVRTDHFYRSIGTSYIKAGTAYQTSPLTVYDSAGVIQTNTSAQGVYCYSITRSNADKDVLNIYSKYNATSTKTIDGTYKVRVYKVDL